MSYLNSAISYVVPILLTGIFSTSVNADRVGPDGYRVIESAPVQHISRTSRQFRPMSPPGYRPIQRFRQLKHPVVARSQVRPRSHPAQIARMAPPRWYPVQRVSPALRGYGAYQPYGYRAQPSPYPQYAATHRPWYGRRGPFDAVPNPYPMVRNRYRTYAPRYAAAQPNWQAPRHVYAPQYARRPVYQQRHVKPVYRRAPAYQPTQQMTYVRGPYQSHYASRDMSRTPIPAGYQRLARR